MDDRHTPSLILTRGDIARLMTPADYRVAVRSAFAAMADGEAVTPAPMHIAAANGGGFHVKGAAWRAGERTWAAFKVNGNFPGNPARRGLPTIQGAVVLCDGTSGEVLALMDSIEVTLQRTAGASALAAEHLAPAGASRLAICGCGAQAPAQLRALMDVRPIREVRLWDADRARARALAALAEGWGPAFTVAETLEAATLESEVIVTCTTAQTPFLGLDAVPPGAFVAAVGADNPAKSELEPALMAAAAVVTDVTDQCAVMGDLHHAIAAGLMSRGQVRAELGELVTARRLGRASAAEIAVFDSTGVAIQDVASAALIYERATAAGVGARVALGAG